MDSQQLKRIILTGLMALCLSLLLSYGMIQPPAAEAAIDGAVAHKQMNDMLHKYNNTEQGRQELLTKTKSQYGVNHDSYLNNQLHRIMANLTKGIGAIDPSIYQKPYNYFINNQKTFNAFCTLGHNLSVNTGLYAVLQNEDEIAVVLAHELAHGQKDHPAQGARRALSVQIIDSASNSQKGRLMAAIANNRHFTKPMEQEADALAFDYITHAGYNPGACAAVWQRVMDKVNGHASTFEKFITDHPANNDRRDAYAKKLNQYSNGHITNQDGVIKVNTTIFCTPAAAGGMSAKERSYFVMGNLAAAYHNGHNMQAAYTNGNTVMLGQQPIITCTSGDEGAQILAERLNKIK